MSGLSGCQDDVRMMSGGQEDSNTSQQHYSTTPPTHEGAQDEVSEKVVAEFDHAEGDPVVAKRDWGEYLAIVGEGKVKGDSYPRARLRT